MAKVGNIIPNIYHFVFLGFTPFMYTHYLAVLTCLIVQRPTTLYLYTHHPPQSKWWEAIQKHPLFPIVKQEKVELPRHIFGNPIEKYQHMADVIRLEKLIERGGVYLDLDVISFQNLDVIRQNPLHIKKGCVMGIQTPNTKFMGLCNAVIIARPQAPFLQRWYQEYKSFRKTRWDYHSVKLPYVLSQLLPQQIQTLGSHFFFPISWEEPAFMENTSLHNKVSSSYLVHIWHSEWSKTVLKNEGPWLLQKRSTFAEKVNNVLEAFRLEQNPVLRQVYVPRKELKTKPKKLEESEKLEKPEKTKKETPIKTTSKKSNLQTSQKLVDITPQRDLISSDPVKIRKAQLLQLESSFQNLHLPFKISPDETVSIQKIKANYNFDFVTATVSQASQAYHTSHTTLQSKCLYSHKDDSQLFQNQLAHFPYCLYPLHQKLFLYPDFDSHGEFTWCHPSQKRVLTISKKECVEKLLQYYFKVSRHETELSVSIDTPALEALTILSQSFSDLEFITIGGSQENCSRLQVACPVKKDTEMVEKLSQLTLPNTLQLFILMPHQLLSHCFAILLGKKCVGCIAKDIVYPTRPSDSKAYRIPRFPKKMEALFNY